MRKIVFAASAIAFCLPGLARAALLRPFSEINGTTVRLGDLFDKLGDTPDRVLGPAPAPGARIEVRAPQLAAIARDFNVDWRPRSGSEQAVIERRGALLPGTSVTAALHSALVAAGAPDDADFAMPDIQPVMLPAGVSPKLDISQCNYDSAGGHFTALLTVSAPDMAAVQMRVSGNVVVLTSAAVPTHRLLRGAEIAAGDVQPLRVRASLLRGNPAILPERAIGMILKHDVAAGKPLTLLDLERQELGAARQPGSHEPEQRRDRAWRGRHRQGVWRQRRPYPCGKSKLACCGGSRSDRAR